MGNGDLIVVTSIAESTEVAGLATTLGIKRWSAWMPGVQSYDDWKAWASLGAKYQVLDEPPPNVQAIPAMLRRRLSSLGKMALSVVWPLVADSQCLPSVFCSRHGELERTVGMLKSLAEGESLSPAHFSLSVHNAIGGVYSIARKDPSAITAVAIGDEGFSQAMVEASLILEEGRHSEVLCVIYDAPVPEIYGDSTHYTINPDKPYAAAFLVGACEECHQNFSVNLVAKSQNVIEDENVSGIPDALQFIRFLIQESDNLYLDAKRHGWEWDRL
ncbi:MAG: beta-ketoacyl synthase chain length factor [Cellvibrionaceae bacterium]